MAIVQEMRRQREQDAKERAEQLKSMREEKSVFTYSLRDDLPVFGDGDSDLDKHLEAFSDVCMVVKLKGDREKLRLFARTLKGTRRRCYYTIIKEAKHNSGDYESKPASVFDRVYLRRLMRRSTREFQVSWLEALTELNSAGVYKCQKDLLYDYLHKIGPFLRDEVSRDRTVLIGRDTTTLLLRKTSMVPVALCREAAKAVGVRTRTRTKEVKEVRAREERLPVRNNRAASSLKGVVPTVTSASLPTSKMLPTRSKTSQTLTAKEKKAAKKKEKDKAKKGASGSDERVYPLFEVSSGSTPGEAGAVVYDSSLQVAEPATKQWRHWPGSLAKVPKDLKTVAAAPSPGYNAQTRTSCPGVELVTLLDS
ncbi:unnamed protein product, partial [Symbiodinium sp. KB8]